MTKRIDPYDVLGVKRDAEKDPENIFAAMLQRHKAQITEAMELNEKETEIRQMALDMVRLYTFHQEAAASPYGGMQSMGGDWWIQTGN